MIADKQMFLAKSMPLPNVLCFTAQQANSTIRLDKIGSPNAISLMISTDDGATLLDYTWSGNTGATITLASIGDKVYFMAKTENQTISKDSSNYYKFVITGKIAASGNIQTLLKAYGSRTNVPEYCYYSMFQNCTSLTTAPALPATTLENRCYYGMFRGCSSLTTAPATLPAMTLTDSCYSYMFRGCSSLTAAPALPATILADDCYYSMFYNCWSLTAAPSLPATTLANFCYYQMFYGCTSLTTAPALPAMTLTDSCYSYMFQDCTSLTTAPALPAMTLTDSCYSYMFRGCSSLTAAPALPATTLVNKCYHYMFYGCSKLASMDVSFTAWNPGTAMNYWANGVAASGTFTCPSALPKTTGLSRIPTGWIIIEKDNQLTFTAQQANSTIHLDKIGSPDEISLETSTDGSTWSDYTWDGSTGATITLANVGDKVSFQANNENSTISKTNQNCYRFVMTGQLAASGSIQTLLKADNSRTDAPSYCYSCLFQDCSAMTVPPKLPAISLSSNCYRSMFYDCTSLSIAPELPASTLATNCYYYMFQGCTSLSTTPTLSATTLADSCYWSMFRGCTNLTSVSDLPATTLATKCYQNMFYGCSSLSVVPARLPATTLADNCYNTMFRSCTSLIDAPLLPATTLTSGCYNSMFTGCNHLSSIKVNFSEWSPSNATTNWVNGIITNGTFTCPAELSDIRGTSNIPSRWTKVDKGTTLCFTAQQENSTVHLDKSGSPDAISLETSTDENTWSDYTWDGSTGNTITLANIGDKVYFRAKNENITISKDTSNYYKFVMTGKIDASGNIQILLKADGSRTDVPEYCYYSMFNSCSSLTAAPELPATTLASNCYDCMFVSCTSLTTAPALPATIVAERCYRAMFSSCTSLTTAPELPAMTLTNSCYYIMFYNCTSLTTAPALPATTLANNCYREMFRGCTSLATAPALPATTLADYCYYQMFHNCSKLASMDVSFTAWSPSSATSNWVNGVGTEATGEKTFTCPSTLPNTIGISNIPSGWTRVNK